MKTETQKDEIDNIRKYSRRPRSSAPPNKCSDFSILCSSSSSSSQSNSVLLIRVLVALCCSLLQRHRHNHIEEGSKSGWYNNVRGLSDSRVTISNGKRNGQIESAEWPRERCSNFKDGSLGFLQKASDCCIKRVESVSSDNTLPDSHDNSDSPMAVESTSEKLQDMQHNSVYTTPKSAVCSETASQNSSAVKATKLRGRKKFLIPLFSSQDVASNNRAAHCDSSNPRISDSVDSGRDHKNQKSRKNYNEVHYRASSGKADRKLKIMRRLGLAPPIGSPY